MDSTPEPPDWLPNAHAVKEFNRLAGILMANRLLTTASVVSLAHLAALHGRVVQLYAAGETPTSAMVGQLRAMQNDFGLTPVASTKVHATDAKPKNKFSSNGHPAD